MSHIRAHDSQPSPSSTPRSRGRHYRHSRGGHGKYLRARGIVHRGGRPAVFQERLLLESEQPEQLDEEEAAECEARYEQRTLSSNADRYEEPDSMIGPDGQLIEEPEVDLSAFRARQLLEDPPESPLAYANVDDDDVDHSLAHITSNPLAERQPRKGRIQQIEWDDSLEEMLHDKDAAQAQSDLKERLRTNAARQMGKTATREHARRQAKPMKEAPPLPKDPHLPTKSPKAEMEDFLNDLLD
ncbi:hypothetical protein F5148DRAFT_1183915 [Russula earlei]|uniref:Uncharacterized protein n=1 Tax=Russula earlei TaxID=71964 RepID=A0ACC0UEC4_9AGAM|nr:hypothetical protein F5148DRAFT_1183915 [Russula earlei]